MERIGRYRIVRRLRSGPVCDLIEADDPDLRRQVRIRLAVSGAPELRGPFLETAEAAATLEHPNLLAVHDFGVHQGRPYLVEEALPSVRLVEMIHRRDFLPYPEKLHDLLQLARGLAHGHDRGLVHGDLRPAHVHVLDDGTVKLGGFGVARLELQESRLTADGARFATPYLAPEQVRGEPASLASDVFSFGVLAYELLTYTLPFEGDGLAATVHQVLHHDPPPLAEWWPAVPTEVVPVVQRCLEKEPSRRWAGGDALREALARLQERGRHRRSVEAGHGPGAASALDELELEGTARR